MKKIVIIFLLLYSTSYSADIFKLVGAIDRNDTVEFISMVQTINDANTARSDNNKTILMYASYKGNKGAVEHLITKGANVNATDSTNATALHLAIWKDHTDIALLLLEKGASTTTMSNDGMTPSDIALIRSNTKIIEAIEASKPKRKSLF